MIDKITVDDAMAYRKNIAHTDFKFLNVCQMRDASGPEITAAICAAHEEASLRSIFACDQSQSLQDFIKTVRDMAPSDADLEMAYNFHRSFNEDRKQRSSVTTQ